MRGIVMGIVLVVGSAVLTASVVPLVLVSLPAVRNDAQLGVGVMTGVFAALVMLGVFVLPWRRRR